MIIVLSLILFVLIAAKIFGEIAERLNQPSLIGEIIAGIIFGPTLLFLAAHFNLPVLSTIPTALAGSEFLKIMADFGIFFLMIIAGMELGLSDVMRRWNSSLLTAIGGVLLPFSLGYFIGTFFHMPFLESIFLGVALSITAIAVSVRTLMGIKRLKTEEGTTILGAAVIDDIIGLIMLTLLIGIAQHKSLSLMYIPIIALKLAGFFIFVLVFYRFVIPSVLNLSQKMRTTESLLSFSIIIAITFAVVSELVGLHFIIGAFFAGLVIRKALLTIEVRAEVNNKLTALALGFFTPIFFVSLGLAMDFSFFKGAFLLTLIIISAAFFGKIFGSFTGAFSSGLNIKKSLRVGIGMNARGAVELIVISVGRELGIVSTELFSIIVVMALVTTILTPILLKSSFGGEKNAYI